MPGRCLVCRNSPEKVPVILHCLPADDARRNKWIAWITSQLTLTLPSSTARRFVPKDDHRVCSAHFACVDYTSTQRGPRLRRSALPRHAPAPAHVGVMGVRWPCPLPSHTHMHTCDVDGHVKDEVAEHAVDEGEGEASNDSLTPLSPDGLELPAPAPSGCQCPSLGPRPGPPPGPGAASVQRLFGEELEHREDAPLYCRDKYHRSLDVVLDDALDGDPVAEELADAVLSYPICYAVLRRHPGVPADPICTRSSTSSPRAVN